LVDVPQWLKTKLKKYSELVGVKLSLVAILTQEFLKEPPGPPYLKLGYMGLVVALVIASYFELKEE